MATHSHIAWRRKETEDEVVRRLSLALRDYALHQEGLAKGKLQPRRGVKTGTLRRSIHAAKPKYDFGRDNRPPSNRTPELGNKAVTPVLAGRTLSVAVGTGMRYASTIEKRYGYMRHARETAPARLQEFIEKYNHD